MVYIDQMMREVRLSKPPSRIVSLVPSQTELLFDLGLKKQMVGVTKFCIHPESEVQSITKVGGTKNPDLSKINMLQPDLVIGNKEENRKEDIEELSKHYPVWMSDVKDLKSAFEMIESLGIITGTESKSMEIINSIEANFSTLEKGNSASVLYLIWKNPFMAASKDTFIDSMLDQCGFVNVIKTRDHYPVITPDDIRALQPDYIFLSSEPYPFKEKEIHELNAIFPNIKVIIVDGEFFSWYGSRLIKAPAYFNELLHLLKSQDIPK